MLIEHLLLLLILSRLQAPGIAMWTIWILIGLDALNFVLKVWQNKLLK